MNNVEVEFREDGVRICLVNSDFVEFWASASPCPPHTIIGLTIKDAELLLEGLRNLPQLGVRAGRTFDKTNNCHNTLEDRLTEQAEISFKAGIRKLGKWLEGRLIKPLPESLLEPASFNITLNDILQLRDSGLLPQPEINS